MPNPIGSRADDPYRAWESSRDDDTICHEGSPKAASAAPRAAETTCSSRDDSALSTQESESGIGGPRAEAHAEGGDFYAGASLLSGRDPKSGLEAELFSASIHQGEREHAVQAGMARMGGSTDDGHFSTRGDVFTAQAHAGFDNADGSTGFGASAGATIVGGEVTGTLGPVSLTLGASVGATYGASAGVRDSDHDGKTEYCARVDFGVGSIGVCLEDRW
jgi:hypothetical protein